MRDAGYSLIQNSSGCTGSRRLMWPDAPSAQPRRANVRKAAAMCFFAQARSACLSVKVGTTCRATGAFPAGGDEVPYEAAVAAVAARAVTVAVEDMMVVVVKSSLQE